MERRDVVRSKQAIKGAYLEICREKPLERITVKEVIDRANVSRGTFYAHFLDIFDLQEKVEDEFLLETMAIHGQRFELLPVNIPKGVEFVMEAFRQHSDMIRALSHNGTNNTFIRKCKLVLRTEFERNFHLTADPAQRGIVQMCVSSVIIDLAMEAALHPESVDVEQAVSAAGRFLRGGVGV